MGIIWSSQITHTAAALVGGKHFLATYTVGASIYAVGMVFDGASRDLTTPERRVELGVHTVELAARAACEAFCRGEVDPELAAVVATAVAAPTPAAPTVDGTEGSAAATTPGEGLGA